jgi:hypothetical protein
MTPETGVSGLERGHWVCPPAKGARGMALLERTCKTEQMNFQRLAARIFVAIGGLLWVFMFFASNTAARYSGLSYSPGEVVDAGVSALIPLGVTVIALAVGWFYEKLAAVLLVLGAVGVVAWGAVAGWETGVWMLVGIFIIAPMLIAALLFWLAARMQAICTLEGHAEA